MYVCFLCCFLFLLTFFSLLDMGEIAKPHKWPTTNAWSSITQEIPKGEGPPERLEKAKGDDKYPIGSMA